MNLALMPLVHSLCTALFSNLGAQTLCCFFQHTKWVTKEHRDKNHNCSVVHHCFPVCLHQNSCAEEPVLLRLGEELAKGWQERVAGRMWMSSRKVLWWWRQGMLNR